jgi:UDPglucose 6-dehydrogenase
MTGSEQTGKQIAVIGVGRVGATTAVGLAHLGHDVVGVDASRARLAALSHGDLAEAEAGLRSGLKAALRFRRLRFTPSLEAATAEIAFLCVDTPPLPSGEADLSQVFSAARDAAAALAPGGVLVTRSTVPVGTGEEIARLLSNAGRGDIEVVHMPEFLREGRAWEDFLEADRLVIGGESAEAITCVEDLFAGLRRPVITTDRRTAELAKYVANAFLATSISFANEMTELAEELGIDGAAVFAILRADRRIGPQAYLTSGLGFGGHCLPKDTAALEQLASAHGQSLVQLRATLHVNQMRPHNAAFWLRSLLGDLSGKTICIAGLTFKPDTDDVRQSPPLFLAMLLAFEGAHVTGWDSNLHQQIEAVDVRPSLEEAVHGADALVLGHGWSGWRQLDPYRLRPLMRSLVVFDAPGVLDAGLWAEAGFLLNHRSNPQAVAAAGGSGAA